MPLHFKFIHSISLSLSRSWSLLPFYGVISCKALLSWWCNFIFATNLQPPLSILSRPLVLSVLSLSLCIFARISLPPVPFGKFTLNAQFHLHRSHPSTMSCSPPKCWRRCLIEAALTLYLVSQLSPLSLSFSLRLRLTMVLFYWFILLSMSPTSVKSY